MGNAAFRIAVSKGFTRKIPEHPGLRFVYHDEVMAFCTNCGTQVNDGARFCANCGSPMGAAPNNLPGMNLAPAPPVPLKYDIEGHNLQVARVHLEPGQEIYAEAGKMVYKSSNVSWETRMSGNTLGQKLLGAIKRRLMGESIMMTYFRTQMAGEVGFAGHYPGKIHVFDLAPGQSIMVQRDGFLFAQSSVQLDIALVRKLGAGLLGGEVTNDGKLRHLAAVRFDHHEDAKHDRAEPKNQIEREHQQCQWSEDRTGDARQDSQTDRGCKQPYAGEQRLERVKLHEFAVLIGLHR